MILIPHCSTMRCVYRFRFCSSTLIHQTVLYMSTKLPIGQLEGRTSASTSSILVRFPGFRKAAKVCLLWYHSSHPGAHVLAAKTRKATGTLLPRRSLVASGSSLPPSMTHLCQERPIGRKISAKDNEELLPTKLESGGNS